MAERGKKIHSKGFVNLVLKTAEVAERGKAACLDLASATPAVVVKAAVAENLVPIGYFAESKTGDGTVKVKIELFQELWAHAWVNDSAAAVTAAHIGKPCYLKDDQTVSSDGTGRSVAGIVLEIRDDLAVSVLMADWRHQLSQAGVSGSGAAGVQVSVDHADASGAVLLAASENPRVLMIEAKCTETVAGDNEPTFSVGIAGTVGLAISVADHQTVDVAGNRKVFACVLPADEDLIATLADGGDVTNDAGAYTYTISAVPA